MTKRKTSTVAKRTSKKEVKERQVRCIWPSKTTITVTDESQKEVKLTFIPNQPIPVSEYIWENHLKNRVKEMNGCCGGVGKRTVNLFQEL